MVRKATPVPVMMPRAEKPAPAAPVSNIDIAGEVGEGTQSMEAMEVDDESIRAEQMISQVSTMVKENPDGAASLVKRWLNRT